MYYGTGRSLGTDVMQIEQSFLDWTHVANNESLFRQIDTCRCLRFVYRREADIFGEEVIGCVDCFSK